MEKVSYGGALFELVPGGFDTFSAGKLILRHQLGGKTLEQIKSIAKNVTGSIDMLDAEDKMMRSLDGYVYAGEIREIEDYLIEEQHTLVTAETGTEAESSNGGESGTPEYEVTEVRADIAVVTFQLPDVRTEMEAVKAVQDEMLVSMLEGGM